MIDEFPELNKDFTRNAKDYLGGNLLFMIDGSGGMTSAYGNVHPDPVICTLSAGLSLQEKAGANVSAKFWGEASGSVDIDLTRNEEFWRRQMPNGQTLLQPALTALGGQVSGRVKKSPLHIIFVSDGIFSDGDPNATMESLDRLRKIPGVYIDVIITEKTILTEPHNRAPLAAMAHTLNRQEEGFDIGVTHVDSPETLQSAVRDFVETRMRPEVLQRAHTEAAVEATMTGLSHAVRALKPPKAWKKDTA